MTVSVSIAGPADDSRFDFVPGFEADAEVEFGFEHPSDAH
jgi:hypothetical protein